MTASGLSASTLSAMSDASNASAAPTLDHLCARLRAQGFLELADDTLDAAAAGDDNLVVLALDNPAQRPEFFDLVVVLPEVLRQFEPGAFRAAFTRPPASATIARRFGVLRHPALIFLRAGRYIGTLEGLRDWQDYVQSFARMRTEAPKPVTIPLAVAGTASPAGTAGATRAAGSADTADATRPADAAGTASATRTNAADTDTARADTSRTNAARDATGTTNAHS